MAKCVLAGAVIALVLAGPARAEEAHGCDGFKWPVAAERSALASQGLAVEQSGASRTTGPSAFALALKPFPEAELPKPPERQPKETSSFAGFVSFAVPMKGTYQVSLSAAAWVDVVQNDRYLKPQAFSGALECPDIRKTVRFDLEAAPFVLQLSGVDGTSINVLVALKN